MDYDVLEELVDKLEKENAQLLKTLTGAQNEGTRLVMQYRELALKAV